MSQFKEKAFEMLNNTTPELKQQEAIEDFNQDMCIYLNSQISFATNTVIAQLRNSDLPKLERELEYNKKELEKVMYTMKTTPEHYYNAVQEAKRRVHNTEEKIKVVNTKIADTEKDIQDYEETLKIFKD